MKYPLEKMLIDASSVLYALKNNMVDIFNGNYILDLTIYEVLNGVWKETYLIKSLSPDEAIVITKLIGESIKFLEILSIGDMEEKVLKKALELGVTVYDAAYIVLAEEHDLILVTEDRKLRNVASKMVKIKSLRELQ